MSASFLLVPILFPVLAGGAVAILPFRSRRGRNVYVETVTLLNSLLILLLILERPEEKMVLIRLVRGMNISFRLDGMACVFAGLLAFLWPLASFYAFEYMEHEEEQVRFFSFYTVTYGITAGVAFSANLVTLYLFYEVLTLITLPLVIHAMDRRSIRAGRKYLIYSIGGATMAFTGIVIAYTYGGGDLAFTYGGFVDAVSARENAGLLRIGYLLMFFGFGVKAAVFPFYGWLPSAGVAPTPVTALLHAVAVVKAGVFAVLRTIYFCYGTALLAGTWAQDVTMAFALFTILFGSCMALKEQHLKRRLAYSTISNLSYILLGATIMTQEGLAAALAHLLFHGLIKITLFFCAGAVMHRTGREYVPDLAGLGRKMPVTFAAFMLASLALTGFPLLPGFVSKWELATAAASGGRPFEYAAVFVLLLSAALTAGYLFCIVIRAFWPGKDFDEGTLKDVRDPGPCMLVPLCVLCVSLILLGLLPGRILSALAQVAGGMI